MTDAAVYFDQVVEKVIIIQSRVDRVWAALTRPELMVQWMSEFDLTITTTWEPGSPFVTRGDMHGILFEATGTVLIFETEHVLTYSHLSSLSQLADEPGNYCILEFRLAPVNNDTELTLTLRNFPTESIYRHMVFYWNVALGLLKRFAEEQSA